MEQIERLDPFIGAWAHPHQIEAKESQFETHDPRGHGRFRTSVRPCSGARRDPAGDTRNTHPQSPTGRGCQLREPSFDEAQLGAVVGEVPRASVGVTRLVGASQASKQFGPGRMQVAEVVELEPVDDPQAGLGAVGFGDGTPESWRPWAGGEMEHADDPTYKDWMSRWRSKDGSSSSGFSARTLDSGRVVRRARTTAIFEETFVRTGVSILGKRMFDGGERFWPKEAPLPHSGPLLTHQVREPWERPGGTTFHFVNDGIDSACSERAGSAGGRDIRIAGGGNAIVQYLNAGLVDEISIALAPVVFRSGIRLFEGIEPTHIGFERGSNGLSQAPLDVDETRTPRLSVTITVEAGRRG